MNKELKLNILQDGFLNLEWEETSEEIPKEQNVLEDELHSRYKKDYNNFLFYLGFTNTQIFLSESLSYIRTFTFLFIKKLAKTPELETLRENAAVSIDNNEINDFLSKSPFINGIEYLNIDVLKNIWQILNNEYKEEIKSYKGKVEDFIKTYRPDIHLAGRVYFHIVESKNEERPFAFLATYTTGLNKEGYSQHIPLKNALNEYGESSIKLLELISTIHTAAKESSIMNEFLNSGEIFHPLTLNANEALQILKEIPIYEKSGILCRIPNWWKNKSNTLRLNIKIGNNRPSFVGMDALLDFNAQILLGDNYISIEEIKQLLSQSEGLAFIKGKWIEVDPEKLKEALKAYEKAAELTKEGLTLKEAMKLQFTAGKEIGIADDEELLVSNGDWLNSVFEKLKKPEIITEVNPGKEFTAELRPYQQKGLNWLYFLNTLNFGACLADDMGLGKTIQLLAFLNAKGNKNKKASLLIIPASLISNWENEIKKFSPSMKYFIAHSSFSKMEDIQISENFPDSYDLVITTYSFVIRYKWLSEYSWDHIILDEAQAIKNPDTKQTKSVKKLISKNKIIMTGTPVENKLEDLWSLFDFLNPGLLGNKKEFSAFSKSLKNNADGYARLKKIIGPYILRRLKTDKAIISDLPDKIEMKTYSELTKRQIVLYEKQVDELAKILEVKTEGIDRKGIILSSLIKFKQLCNHPDQFLGQKNFEETDSGKFIRLREICEAIYEKREKVLVFTQFAEIIDALKSFMDGIFKHEGVVLHGGVQVKKRKEIVEKFQSHEYVPFMILSLKAGGVGLNLTKANHVIHFDRWWNPAVENQATDRAFRIGQNKNVIVHKFITKGTIEEKIDQMIENKKSLARDVVGESGEAWITEFDNKKLMELFTLSL